MSIKFLKSCQAFFPLVFQLLLRNNHLWILCEDHVGREKEEAVSEVSGAIA
jgi:hypothetical protein